MHKAVQEVKEKHVYQKVPMERIKIEKGAPPVEIRKADRRTREMK